MKLTVAEYAKRTGESKQRIYKRLDGDLKEFLVIEGGVKYIRVDEAEQTPAQVEKKNNLPEEKQEGKPASKPPIETVFEPDNGELRKAEQRIAELEKELAEARKEVSAERQKVLELMERVLTMTENAQTLTSQAQVLTSQSQTLLLTDGKQKKPWYKRLFSGKTEEE